ncbi:RNA polymerase sigma factor [Engelhardtia mirabilis]|uniref:ECF RNA polymerase sigma factor SigE n=1 Tax=Engelhardtia mirabilis TaxID=2528011 RepID=A0A518BGT9_9BACT|nr:ECF RNA polymerase sigma factor SigE [Planctomycetes bacterium Pla133]QDV00519.1 ECF RNA polymerase sigma factor SigE [Planctomycetes bacterium Pla86]
MSTIGPEEPEADALSGAPDTNEVVREIRAGDEQRFDELYRRVAPALYAWLKLRLGAQVRRQVDPEDVLQEIWLRALRAFPRFDPERASFRGWIFQVMKYELLDTFRSSAGAAAQSLRGGHTEAGSSGGGGGFARLSEVPDPVTSFTRRIARDEGMASLVEHLAGLPEEERALVVHCGLEGRPASEVAVVLGLSHEAARKRWLRLRDSLRERAWARELLADAG